LISGPVQPLSELNPKLEIQNMLDPYFYRLASFSNFDLSLVGSNATTGFQIHVLPRIHHWPSYQTGIEQAFHRQVISTIS
jgi:hypothetical protein